MSVIIWKDVVGYEGLYKVSNTGELYSFYTNKILSPTNQKSGYFNYTITKNKVKNVIGAHRIVALAFLENKENKPCVNHKNAIKKDNRVENLEWATHKENIQHAIKLGLWINTPSGNNHYRYGKKAHNSGNNSRIKKNCKTCNKSFLSYESNNKKYCSRNCAFKIPHNKGKSKYKEIKCDWCNNLFKPNSESNKWCSISCSSLSRESNKRP